MPFVLVVVFFSLQAYWIGSAKFISSGKGLSDYDVPCPLRAGKAIGQIFLARDDNLYRVRLPFLAPEGAEEIQVEFHIQGVGRHGREYARLALTVRETAWVDFSFESIPDSKGHLYHFYLVALEESDVPIQVAIATDDPYPEGRAYGQGVPKGSDILFDFYHSNTIYDKLDDIVAGKPFVFGSRLFLAAVLIFYNLAVTVLLFRLWN